MLRDQSQRSGRKLVEIAEAVVGSHLLLRFAPQLAHEQREGPINHSRTVVL